MDSTFEVTNFNVNSGAGWGADDQNSAPPYPASSTSAFERVPLPVSIEDIINGQISDDKIHLGAYAFGTLRVCGRILRVEPKENDTQIVICDPTATDPNTCAQLSVIVYQNAQGFAKKEEDEIVMLLGKVRMFGDTTSFFAFGITSLDDNSRAEVFNAEAELAKRYYTNDVPARLNNVPCPPEFEGTIMSTKSIEPTTRQNTTTQFDGGYNAGNNFREMKPNVSAAGNRGLSGLRGKILSVIQESNMGEQGLSVDEIKNSVGGANNPDFDQDLSYLVNEGIIYNTMDAKSTLLL